MESFGWRYVPRFFWATIFVCGMFLAASQAFGDTTGSLSPGSVVVTATGGASWSPNTVENVESLDGSFNTLVLPASTTSDTVFQSGFNPQIPFGATIDGIRLNATMRLTGFGGGDTITANVGFENESILGTPQVLGAFGTGGSFITGSFGGPTDTWGRTWTPTEINSANFGYFATFASGAGGTVDAEVSSIEVFFTPISLPASNTWLLTALAITMVGLAARYCVAGTTLSGRTEIERLRT